MHQPVGEQAQLSGRWRAKGHHDDGLCAFHAIVKGRYGLSVSSRILDRPMAERHDRIDFAVAQRNSHPEKRPRVIVARVKRTVRRFSPPAFAAQPARGGKCRVTAELLTRPGQPLLQISFVVPGTDAQHPPLGLSLMASRANWRPKAILSMSM